MKKELIKERKKNGRIYTPLNIVRNILDLSGYTDNNILKKHVIDNSCGDGAFLTEIVERYCKNALKNQISLDSLKKDLSTYIHGIEIEPSECEKCIANLNSVINKYNIPSVFWDIRCADSLTVQEYNGKMDFVLGNPPYVRVHNLGETLDCVKQYKFAKQGMTDLYIVFYEIGLQMLNKNGVLGYITPSSFFTSVAGKRMREYFVKENLIDKIVDLKHFQPFNSVTYTTIVILKNNKLNKEINYYNFDNNKLIPYYVDTLTSENYYICGDFYFSNKEELFKLNKVLSFDKHQKFFDVKNGFATLADGFFIGDLPFSEYVIPVLKASTGKWMQCFFPYRNNKLVPYEELASNPRINQYYYDNKETLQSRSLENKLNWHGFGRTQGIKDVGVCKYAINSLLRGIEDIRLEKCAAGTGVYSGLYILTDVSEEEIKSILLSEEFIEYVSMLGKYKNGGYYTFSSKDLKCYLNYKYVQNGEYKYEQFGIFKNA